MANEAGRLFEHKFSQINANIWKIVKFAFCLKIIVTSSSQWNFYKCLHYFLSKLPRYAT